MKSLFPLVVMVVRFIVLNLAAVLIWVERRLLALWQDRYGPNRVGPFGLLHRWPIRSNYSRKKTGFRPSPINRYL